jgi:hypothetical protein
VSKRKGETPTQSINCFIKRKQKANQSMTRIYPLQVKDKKFLKGKD